MIFHITTRAAWQAASDVYTAPSLAAVGFIHASARDQLLRVANALYAGQPDLIVLVIDPDALTADLRWEAPEPDDPHAAERFPHIYGPLNTDAVVQVVDLPAGPDGTFRMPDALDA